MNKTVLSIAIHLILATNYAPISRQFDRMTSNTEHLKEAQKAVMEASSRAMNNPRKFAKPCTMTALAVAMATPLSIIIRSSIANTIIACVGGKDEQSKVRINK